MTTKTNMEPIIHFAPLQGYTDTDYREVFFKTIGNIDRYYSPYLSLEKDGSVRSIPRILANNNHQHKTVLDPQILPGSLDELISLSNIVVGADYNRMNINLGCPYPMVTKRGRGAALLQNPEMVNSFLTHLKKNYTLDISLKMRVGMEQSEEIFFFLDQLDHTLIKEIILHPRTAKQLYKGKADRAVFSSCKEKYPNTYFIYNGDIDSFAAFVELTKLFQDQKNWMIGRGLIANPLLARQIKTDTEDLPSDKNELLLNFCLELYKAIHLSSNDDGHALNRIRLQLLAIFETREEKKKLIKTLKKAKKYQEVESLIYQLV